MLNHLLKGAAIKHDEENILRLQEMRSALITDMADIDNLIEILKKRIGHDDKSKATVYIGCHSNSRKENGEPTFKIDIPFIVESYQEATRIVRILKISFDRLKNIPDHEQESYLSELMKDKILGDGRF